MKKLNILATISLLICTSLMPLHADIDMDLNFSTKERETRDMGLVSSVKACKSKCDTIKKKGVPASSFNENGPNNYKVFVTTTLSTSIPQTVTNGTKYNCKCLINKNINTFKQYLAPLRSSDNSDGAQ